VHLIIFGFVAASMPMTSASAEEEKKAQGEKKEGGEGEKKAEGGEGEGKKTDGADREWAKRTTHINVIEAKIKELKTNIILYVKAKNGNYAMLDEKGVKIDVVKKIAETYKELEKSIDDYGKAKDELRFRFPEEGTVIDRKYVPLRLQTLEQIEKESGLNGDLDRTKENMDKKYEAFVGEKKIVPVKREGQPESTLKEIKKTTKSSEPTTEQPERIKISE
jgi:hypothetical protein